MTTDPHPTQPAWLNAQCPREGRYVIGPILGRGGMGSVHEAWDVILCRTVALKILKDIEPPALIRFMHEAQIHARVVHPNICRIYDVDNYEGTLRVAMQLIHGDSLECAYRDLSLKEVVSIVAQVARALHVVHRLHLVHRDLKPSNILLERAAEGGWVPYVCDFGLAMALDEPALTFSHSVLGTPAYMAPEQFHGERERISAATDVYALGGTLHYALTGHPPSGPTGASRAQSTADPRVPRDLQAIIARCLEEDPQLRYASANALAEDLFRFLEGEPVQAGLGGGRGQSGRVARARHWLRSARRPLYAACAVLVLLGGATAYRAWRRGADSRQAALVQQMALESGELALEIQLERTLPLHDLRPAFARLRRRLEQQRLQMAALAPPWQEQGHVLLGLTAYLLRDFQTARQELDQAWEAGCLEPFVAIRLATATLVCADQQAQEAEFDTGLAPPATGPEVKRAQDLLAGIRATAGRDTEDFVDALSAYLGGDYQRAVSNCRSYFASAPWNCEPEVLENLCFVAMAQQSMAAGDLATARRHYQDALASANRALAVAPSDQGSRHAYFRAARGLAELDRERGSLSLPWLDELQDASDQALGLDPEDLALLDDWLAIRWLRAMRMLDLGQDPKGLLEEARVFLSTQVRVPLPAALRADRMMLDWLMAERDSRFGSDPGPALAQALQEGGHTPFLGRDYFQEVRNGKARFDMSRGIDPRPVLGPSLDHAALNPPGSWPLHEALAESWLIRGQWEQTHGLDSRPSIQKARTFATLARQQNPASAPAYALEGLVHMLELQAVPGRRRELLAQATDRLRLSQRLGFGGANQDRLQRALRQPGAALPS